MRRDSRFCAKSVRYNIFTNGAPYTCFDRLYVCSFGNIVFITERWDWFWFPAIFYICISLRHLQIIAVNYWRWLTNQFLLLRSFKNF